MFGAAGSDGIYVEDQFKATPKLTINLGFRNDMVWTPIYGTGKGGNFYTGNANPVTGKYQLNALPPNCSATQGAPCIPNGIYTASSTPGTGQLPANAYVSPSLRVVKNSLADWAPRFGLAYRLNDKTVIRAAYSRFYDEWADITQLSQNFGGNWPAVNTIQNNGLNAATPTVTAADPLQFGSGGTIDLSHQRLQPGEPVDGGSRTSRLRSSISGTRASSGSCRAI